MTPQLIAAVVVALAGFGSAWQIQSWRYQAKEAQHEQQKLADVQQSAAATIRRADNVIAAQDAAQTRDSALRLDAAGARDALERLHDAAADALRAAGASQAACLERAATLSELHQASARRYVELGEKADRHASDVKTLVDAWPR